LDTPSEYYLDIENKLLHLIPPETVVGPPTSWPRGPVLGLKKNVICIDDTVNVELSDLSVVDGVVGISAVNVTGSLIENVAISLQSQNGIVMTQAKDATIRDVVVSDVGCGGIRAHGGDAISLTRGNVSVTNASITSFALWKRTYEAGIHWSGVGNTYRKNVVRNGPHNCLYVVRELFSRSFALTRSLRTAS